MSSSYSHVRGDTFSVLHLRQQKDGTARDLTGYQIYAELQHRAGQLVEVLTVTVLDQTSHAGKFVLSVPDTAAWPLARLRYKIQFTDPQGVITTSGCIDLRVTDSYPADCCADEPTVQVSISPEMIIVEADQDQLFVQVGTVISAVNGNIISKPAAIPLNAYKLMTTDGNGHAIYADAANRLHVNRLIGLSLTAAQTNGFVQIQSQGQVINQGWNLPVGAMLYAGLDGDLSTDSTVGVFAQIVGYVISPNTIFLQPSLGILRAI